MTTEPAVPGKGIGHLSPREQLGQWANAQDSWVRLLVSLIIASGREPTEEELQRVYEHLLAEKRVSAAEFAETDQLSIDAGGDEHTETLQLTRLSDIQNVNALAEGQLLDFGESLTVLFGQNASGKTGYARVLKRMANVRTAEEILGDAHDPAGDQPPTANLAYEIDGVSSNVQWQNQLGLSPLNRMSVFDSPAVALHVNSELGYTFTPAEMNLFRLTNGSIKRIQERLREQANEHDGTALRSLLASFNRGSSVFPLIETLEASAEIEQLRVLAEVSDDERQLEAQLRQDIATLESGSRDAVLAEAKLHRDTAKAASAALLSLSRFDAQAFNSALDLHAGAVDAVKQARKALAADGALPPQLDDNWQELIRAADSYQRQLGQGEYPEQGDVCPYCRQALDSHAHARISKYRELIEGALNTAVTARQKGH